MTALLPWGQVQNQLDQARDAIEIGLANVERRPMHSPESEYGKRDADAKRRGWHRLEGRLAELEGNPQKALALYQSFLQPYATTLTGKANWHPAPEVSQQIAEIKKFYLAHGGKEESWPEWAASGPKPDSTDTGPERLRDEVMLPDFAAKDLDGKSWNPT